MDISMIVTGVGIVVSFAGIMCAIFRNFKIDNQKFLDKYDAHNESRFNALRILIEKSDIMNYERNLNAEKYFNNIDKRFDKMDERFNQIDKLFWRVEDKFDQQNAKFMNINEKIDDRCDRIDREIKEIRTSVNRLEGAFYNQECCVVKGDKKTKKKAE